MPPAGALFSTADAAAILEISARRIVLLVEQEIIAPAVPAEGRGHPRKFSLLDLIRIRLAEHLVSLGMAPRFVKRWVDVVTVAKANSTWQSIDWENPPSTMPFFGDFNPDALLDALPDVVVVTSVRGDATSYLADEASRIDISSLPPTSVCIRFRQILMDVLEQLDAHWRRTGALPSSP